MNDIKTFEKSLLERYTIETEYRGYLYRYYYLFVNMVLTNVLKNRDPDSTVKEMVKALYADIIDSVIAEQLDTFMDLNKAIVTSTQQIIQIRFGDHSDEYLDTIRYSEYIAIIFTEIEKLAVNDRVPIKVSFIHAFDRKLERLFRRLGSKEKKVEKQIELKLIGMSYEKVAFFFHLICQTRESIRKSKKISFYYKIKCLWISKKW